MLRFIQPCHNGVLQSFKTSWAFSIQIEKKGTLTSNRISMLLPAPPLIRPINEKNGKEEKAQLQLCCNLSIINKAITLNLTQPLGLFQTTVYELNIKFDRLPSKILPQHTFNFKWVTWKIIQTTTVTAGTSSIIIRSDNIWNWRQKANIGLMVPSSPSIECQKQNVKLKWKRQTETEKNSVCTQRCTICLSVLTSCLICAGSSSVWFMLHGSLFQGMILLSLWTPYHQHVCWFMSLIYIPQVDVVLLGGGFSEHGPVCAFRTVPESCCSLICSHFDCFYCWSGPLNQLGVSRQEEGGMNGLIDQNGEGGRLCSCQEYSCRHGPGYCFLWWGSGHAGGIQVKPF